MGGVGGENVGKEGVGVEGGEEGVDAEGGGKEDSNEEGDGGGCGSGVEGGVKEDCVDCTERWRQRKTVESKMIEVVGL